jgi:hypothetical protein
MQLAGYLAHPSRSGLGWDAPRFCEFSKHRNEGLPEPISEIDTSVFARARVKIDLSPRKSSPGLFFKNSRASESS